MDPLEKQQAEIRWDEHGNPHSTVYNDKYFCKYNGYEEALYVCCEGNALRKRFSELDPGVKGTFTIIETGFGTGLDFCTVWQLWHETAPRSWMLHFLSVELFPISADQIKRALELWPALSRFKDELAACYKVLPGGIEDLYFDEKAVRLTIVFDDVVQALKRIKENDLAPAGADVWLLDGFAPSKNPRMWSDEVFEVMAPLSRQGTTLSTFTVAGHVRRGLEANGFLVQRVPGYGKKNKILTGEYRKFETRNSKSETRTEEPRVK